MRHHPFKFFAIVLCLVAFMASCSDNTDLVKAIPDDAFVVVDINMEQLWKKGDLKNSDELAFVKMLRQELRNENAAVSAIVDGIFNDPASTGIDLRGDIVCFADANLNVVVAAAMKNQKKFKSCLEKIAGCKLNIDKADGVSHIVDFGGSPVNLSWDRDKAVLLLSQGSVIDLMHLDKGKSLASNKDFAQYWKNRGDISFWCGMKPLFELADMFDPTAIDEFGPYADELKEASACVDIAFEKGYISIKSETFGIASDSELMKIVDAEFDDAVLSFVPEQCLAAVTYACNIEYLNKYFSTLTTFADIFEETVMGDITFSDVINCLGGSLVASVYDFGSSDKNGVVPLFSAAFSLRDVDKAAGILEQSGMKKSEGCFVIPSVPLYMGISGEVFYVTNATDVVDQIRQGGYKNGLGDKAKKAKENYYIYADLSIDHYPSTVSGLLPAQLVDLLRQYLDYTEFSFISKTSGEWKIYLADKTQNSLAATLHFVDDNMRNLANLIESSSDETEYDEEFYIDADYE